MERTMDATPEKISEAALIIQSSELFKDSKLVLIQHKDQRYRLMVTKQGKLILTK